MMINTTSNNTTISYKTTSTTPPFLTWLSQVTDVTSKLAANSLLLQYANTEVYSTSDEYPPNRMTVQQNNVREITGTDEYDICTTMSDFLVRNHFEPSMNSCQCVIPDELPDVNTTRSFIVDCSDETYEQCLGSSEEYCIKSRSYLFLDNLDVPGSTSLAGVTGCLHYTSSTNNANDVCITTSTGIETSCQIQIGDEFCDQCELVRCNKGDLNNVTTNYTKIFDNTNNVGMSFTCPTSQGTKIYMNQCGYVPYTNVPSPVCNGNDPMRFLCHPYNNFAFNSQIQESSSGSILPSFLLIVTAFWTTFVLR